MGPDGAVYKSETFIRISQKKNSDSICDFNSLDISMTQGLSQDSQK